MRQLHLVVGGAKCIAPLKYSNSKDSKDSVEVAEKFFEHILSTANTSREKATSLWNLTLLSLMKNDNKKAIAYLKRASIINPEIYRIEDWEPYKATYLNSQEFTLWNDIAKRIGVNNLVDRIEYIHTAILQPNIDEKAQQHN